MRFQCLSKDWKSGEWATRRRELMLPAHLWYPVVGFHYLEIQKKNGALSQSTFIQRRCLSWVILLDAQEFWYLQSSGHIGVRCLEAFVRLREIFMWANLDSMEPQGDISLAEDRTNVALLTFKSLHAIAPSYLSSLVHPYVPSRALRSSSAHQLCVPHVSTVFGSRGFRSAGPTIWNSLPLSVTSCSTIHTFKKQLKTHLFASAFPSSWIVLDAPLIRWSPFMYLFGCPWFCACLNVCYYYYYYSMFPQNFDTTVQKKICAFLFWIL